MHILKYMQINILIIHVTKTNGSIKFFHIEFIMYIISFTTQKMAS